MRRKPAKLRMALRGRTGLLAYIVIGSVLCVALYYAWTSVFPPASRKTYSTKYRNLDRQLPNQLDFWQRQRMQQNQERQQQQFGQQQQPQIPQQQQMQKPPSPDRPGGNVLQQPPDGQFADLQEEMNQKALQDRLDEERIAREQAKETEKMQVQVKEQQKHTEPENPIYQLPQAEDGDYFRSLDRFVHLDLKGAPPLVSYLEVLFPFFRSLGATGLLIEYEDMFPYSGNLSILAAENAYSRSDIDRILSAAKQSGLEVVPLVQTFGHMEFVLKHERFMHLRENSYTPQVISPVSEESYSLINNMIEQILQAHPDAKHIHLGCDEVYGLGDGQSHIFMVQRNLQPQDLFLQHVVKIADSVKSKFQQVQPLIWDDWIRKTPEDSIKKSRLPSLVEPMVWLYVPNILDRIPMNVWEKYGRLFPNGVWVASAFKGATGAAQYITNATFHLDNNLCWVSLMRKLGLQKKLITFRGLTLTGWQRYDHFATLCELLPVGLPSLALCLQAVQNGGFSPREHEKAGKILQCSGPLNLDLPPAKVETGVQVNQDCGFPGSGVFYGVQQLHGLVYRFEKDRGLQERISGWLTDRNVHHGFSSPGQMGVLSKKLSKLIDEMQSLIAPMQTQLLQIYDSKTVNEWVETNLQDRREQLKALLVKAKALKARKTWGSRYEMPAVSTSAPQNAGSIVQQQPGYQGQVRVYPITNYTAGQRQFMNRMQGNVNMQNNVLRPQGQDQGPQASFNYQGLVGKANVNPNLNPAGSISKVGNNQAAGVNNNLLPSGNINSYRNLVGSMGNMQQAGGPRADFGQASSLQRGAVQAGFGANGGSMTDQQGGRLSQTLLRKPSYPFMPSGPGKMPTGDSAVQNPQPGSRFRGNAYPQQQQQQQQLMQNQWQNAGGQGQGRSQFLDKLQQPQGMMRQGQSQPLVQNQVPAAQSWNRGVPEGPGKDPSYSQMRKNGDEKPSRPGMNTEEKKNVLPDKKFEDANIPGQQGKTGDKKDEKEPGFQQPKARLDQGAEKQGDADKLKFEKEGNLAQDELTKQGSQEGNQMLDSFMGRGQHRVGANSVNDADKDQGKDTQNGDKAQGQKDYKDYDPDYDQ